MSQKLSRRDWIRVLGASGLAAGLGGASRPGAAAAAEAKRTCPAVVDGKVIQPERELPVLHSTDVLVVGAGPAGVCAAIAAKRAGVEVTLVERYGHFGGLWTGGLVLLVIPMFDKNKKQVTLGIGEEMLQALDKLDGGIVNHRPGANPTVDAEAAKYVMVEMIREANVNVYLHCWGVDAIMDGDTIRGAVFESKSGRQAILAKMVIDATGDGDVFAAAGAAHETRRYDIGLVSRLGNLDKVDHAKAKAAGVKKPDGLGSITPIPGVHWVNMRGPAADGLDVAELTRLEMNHRRFIWRNLQKIRKTPGYEQVYLMETAPQLGVRITRVLDGMKRLTLRDAQAGVSYPDVIGYGGADGAQKDAWQIPYGALVPKKIDNVLAAGRCISGEQPMADLLRLIAACFVTGQAAGVAAALAVKDSCRARDVDVPKLQAELRKQGAYLG